LGLTEEDDHGIPDLVQDGTSGEALDLMAGCFDDGTYPISGRSSADKMVDAPIT
jgi:hypothetical protein